MSATEASVNDYSTGAPRRHHSLYIEDGNLVFQVENAIFKVHRSFLVKCSTVVGDMLNAPQSSELGEATDERPLVFSGDNVSGWEVLLESHYGSPHFDPKLFNGERLLSILPIAHKYCMEAIEGALIKRLQEFSDSKPQDTSALVDLMVASQILDSNELYEKALSGLRMCTLKPNSEQASRIGFATYFAVMQNVTVKCVYCDMKTTLACSS